MALELSKMTAEKRTHIEANSRWALIYPWSANIEHPKGNFKVDRGFFLALSEFMEDHRGIYYTPFAAKHDSPGPSPEDLPDDARNKGRVIDLREGTRGIEALIYFGKGLAQQFDEGLIDSLSPAHYTQPIKSLATGKTYRTALREVSSVVVRHLKNMPGASPWYQLDEQELGDTLISLEEDNDMTTQNPEQPKAVTMADVEQLITQHMGQINTKIEGLTKKAELPVTQNAESEPTAEQRQIVELQRQLKDMERKSLLADARAKVTSRYPKLDAAGVTAMAEGLVAAGDKGDALLEQVSKLAPAQEHVAVNAEQGAPGNPAQGPVTKGWDAAMGEAVAAGHKVNSVEAILFISGKYPALAR